MLIKWNHGTREGGIFNANAPPFWLQPGQTLKNWTSVRWNTRSLQGNFGLSSSLASVSSYSITKLRLEILSYSVDVCHCWSELSKILSLPLSEFDVCVTGHHWYNNVNSQLDATIIILLIISISSTCFRAIISPILRSTRLCLQHLPLIHLNKQQWYLW